MPIRPTRSVTVLAALLAVVALACGPTTKFAVQHTLGADLGPCNAPRDSVRRERGDPERTVVGDEEDVSDGTQVFEHELGYPLPAEDGSPRTDSLEVVRFRWGAGVRGCEVDTRVARRLGGGITNPWEEAP